MNEDLKKEQYELEGRSELLTEADEKFSIAVATILSLGNNAYQIFQSSKVETKREILHLLLSNLKLQDRKISYTLRKPFDWVQSLNKKTPSKKEGVAIGDAVSLKLRKPPPNKSYLEETKSNKYCSGKLINSENFPLKLWSAFAMVVIRNLLDIL